MSTWKFACSCALSDGVPRRSLYVALVVGTVLNLINQGDALIGAGSIDWLKVVLTYCVPYAVCTSVPSQPEWPRAGPPPSGNPEAACPASLLCNAKFPVALR